MPEVWAYFTAGVVCGAAGVIVLAAAYILIIVNYIGAED